MTDNIDLTAVATSLVSLAGFLVLLRLYRDYSVDRFREEMFALRDEMFDFAAAGGIAFGHPAYGRLRLTMNGFARRASRLGLMEIVLFRLLSRRDRSEIARFDADGEKALDGLDDTSRRRWNDFRNRMHRVVIAHLFRSPVAIATLITSPVTRATGGRFTEFARERTGALLAGAEAVALLYGEAPTTANGRARPVRRIPATPRGP